ncbi:MULTISPECIES: DUF4124 domain-containing protein [unclassified Halomonas]|uniref:DUF4124 domain-containing protein n=1 Tax=unclassified Halomonas TaxID=2609666 RepID=UPI002886E834|nr:MULTISPECIES: DUF4124 domain-containing protein [unclassified Halomonas]MDT0499942.1 DUF4124 domain-containing protein [Halomonas sp. PAR7]MDT0590980.1 DUF4124 domain-containing protein [Halomonas sp. PAR8]
MGKTVLTLVLALGVTLTAYGQTIYRTTDAQGNVVFTDDPDLGGEQVELAPVTVVPSRGSADAGQVAPRPTTNSAPATSRPGQPFMPYDSFRIVSPTHEQAFPVGVAGNIAVDLGISPGLREDHRVRLLVDGQISQSAMHTSAFMVPNMNPGEHVLQAELLDARGEIRHRTSPVTIYVLRANVNRPTNG